MKDKTFLQSVASWAWILANDVKKRVYERKVYKQWLKDVKNGAKQEAEKIFMKTQPWVKWNPKSYPKVNNLNYNDQWPLAWLNVKKRWEMYGRRAGNVEKQVVETRVKQYKLKNKSGK